MQIRLHAHLPDTSRLPTHTSHKQASWNRVVVVSNRLPFTCVIAADGTPKLSPSSGGLVTALSPLLHKGIRGKWVGSLAGEDEGLAQALRSLQDDAVSSEFGIVKLTTTEEQEYYTGYANQVLVPLLVGTGEQPNAQLANTCWHTYQRVQRLFASAVQADTRPGDIVWVHDYHLIGVGRDLRNQRVTQPLGFFLHTPFPKSQAFAALPEYQARALLTSLLAYDLLGFQTRLFQDRFIATIRTYVPQARIVRHENSASIEYRGHITRTGNFPVSIDVDAFERQLFARKTQRNIERLDAVLRKDVELQVLFSAGRLDYAKGFYEELRAYETLLAHHPELVTKLVLIQLVIPSRTDVGAYREYRERITELAARINQAHGRKVVHQIHARMSSARYLAHLHVANVQSVPTLSDGMNLIAKESAVVGHKTTVLILGEAAGAAEEFRSHALLVDPRDTTRFADTLYRALTMPLRERRSRKSQLKGIVTMHDVFDWWTYRIEPVFQEIWNTRNA